MPGNQPHSRNTPRRMILLAAGLLLLLTALFMGKTLIPASDEVLAGHDIAGAFYPWLRAIHEGAREGRLPLWDPDHYAGSPLFSNPQVGLFYPPAWLAIPFPVNVSISLYVLLHLWLAALGMLLFTRVMGADHSGALLAAVSFGLSGFFAARLWAGHIGLMATYTWTPWLLLATAHAHRRRTRGAALLAGVPFGLAVLAGHPTSLIYILAIWLGFGLYLAITTREWLRVTYVLMLAGIAGLALGAVEVIPLLESLPYSVAGGAQHLPDGSFPWSMPPGHLIALLAPDLVGDPLTGYSGPMHFEEMTYYTGILPLFGLAYALRRPRRLAWLYLGLMVFGMLMALGSYGFLYGLMHRFVPLFRAARAPARAMSMVVFALCALLADSFTRWKAGRAAGPAAPAGRGWLTLALGMTAPGAAGMIGTTLLINGTPTGDQRVWAALLRALATALTGAGLLWAFTLRPAPGSRLRGLPAAGLIAFALLDLWLYGARLLYTAPLPPNPFWQDARAMLGQPAERVTTYLADRFPTHYEGQAGMAGMQSARGYGPLFLRSNAMLTDPELDLRGNTFDILNVGYVIAAEPLDDLTGGEAPLTLIGRRGDVWVYRRARALPLARLVDSYEVIGEEEAVRARLEDESFDPAETAILDHEPPCTPGEGAAGDTARVTAHRPEYWQIETQSVEAALLVLAESAYPGWRVTVDGQPAGSLTAYGGLRAVCVPTGTHRVEWRFDPASYKIGGAISLLTLALAGIALARGEARVMRDDAQTATQGKPGHAA